MSTAISIEPYEATHPQTLDLVTIVGIANLEDAEPKLVALYHGPEGSYAIKLDHAKPAHLARHG
jgi:hypothetical protein